MSETRHDDSALRRIAFSIAYRMLGSVADAEDIVQETMLRLHQAGRRSAIESEPAYVTTVATRLAIDHLRLARRQREQYFGPWLPEPLVGERVADASQPVELADTLSMAMLVVLETLTPVERAVFVLREVFDYGYDEIAGIVGRSEDNCRQLASRARRHVDERRPRFDVPAQQRDELAARFFAACGDGDLEGLVELLAEDVVLYGDGGGKGPAAAAPVFGLQKVARVIHGFTQQAARADIGYTLTQVNGQPGAVFADADGSIVFVMSLDIAGGLVQTVRSVVNPDKLGHLGPLADFQELARRLHERRAQ